MMARLGLRHYTHLWTVMSTKPAHEAYAELIELLQEHGYVVHATDFDYDVDKPPSHGTFELSATLTYTGESETEGGGEE